MQVSKKELVNLTIVFDDGSHITKNFTPTDLAAFKKSNKWKQRLSVKKNFSVEIIMKFPDSKETTNNIV